MDDLGRSISLANVTNGYVCHAGSLLPSLLLGEGDTGQAGVLDTYALEAAG
jgi:hypothetical protein